MENILVKTASFALSVLEHYIRPGDCVVDATIGNGNDTLKLCQLVGETGKVYGFDIQEKALKNTASLLQKNGWNNAVLLHVSHAAISEFIKEKIQAAVFNLGYLPGGDHSVTTCTDETKKSNSLLFETPEQGRCPCHCILSRSSGRGGGKISAAALGFRFERRLFSLRSHGDDKSVSDGAVCFVYHEEKGGF